MSKRFSAPIATSRCAFVCATKISLCVGASALRRKRKRQRCCTFGMLLGKYRPIRSEKERYLCYTHRRKSAKQLFVLTSTAPVRIRNTMKTRQTSFLFAVFACTTWEDRKFAWSERQILSTTSMIGLLLHILFFSFRVGALCNEKAPNEQGVCKIGPITGVF